MSQSYHGEILQHIFLSADLAPKDLMYVLPDGATNIDIYLLHVIGWDRND